jgi:hypothetical protein
VRGAVEKCSSGAVLLIPADGDMRWFGFLHSVRCDATDHYEIDAVRPGEYYLLAFAGRDAQPSLDEGVLRQAQLDGQAAGDKASPHIFALAVAGRVSSSVV